MPAWAQASPAATPTPADVPHPPLGSCWYSAWHLTFTSSRFNIWESRAWGPSWVGFGVAWSQTFLIGLRRVWLSPLSLRSRGRTALDGSRWWNSVGLFWRSGMGGGVGCRTHYNSHHYPWSSPHEASSPMSPCIQSCPAAYFQLLINSRWCPDRVRYWCHCRGEPWFSPSLRTCGRLLFGGRGLQTISPWATWPPAPTKHTVSHYCTASGYWSHSWHTPTHSLISLEFVLALRKMTKNEDRKPLKMSNKWYKCWCDNVDFCRN